MLALVPTQGGAQGATFTVSSTDDAADVAPGDGSCDATPPLVIARAAAQGPLFKKCTLRAAIQEANALPGDDVITLPAGTYGLTIFGGEEDAAATGDLDIVASGGKVTINGAGPDSTIIDGGGVDRVLDVLSTAGFALSGVTVSGGRTCGPGGGIRSAGTLTLENSTVSGNTAISGSGSCIQVTTALLINATGAGDGGGIYHAGAGLLAVTNSTIRGNTADGIGGGILNIINGTLSMTNSIVSGNTAAAGGSGIFNGGTAALTASTIRFNRAPGVGNAGGGITNTLSLTLSNSIVSENSAEFAGGGISNLGSATLTSSTVSGNKAGQGGGIFNSGTATLTSSTISGNLAVTLGPAGGGIYVLSGSLSLTNSTVSGNTASMGGGGGIASRSTLSVTNSIVSGNIAGTGGGIYSLGTLSLSNSTVSGNNASRGGGISNSGEATLTNSTISANTAHLIGGGGIFNNVTLTLSNSTVSGNSALGMTGGGGIYIAGPTSTTLLNSTVTANMSTGGPGGGIYNEGGALSLPTLENSIIAGNTALDCDGPVTSLGHNIDGNGSCNLVAGGDRPAVDPLLGPLQDNGGPTRTHALLVGSPAIHVGSDIGAPPSDQRGLPRVGISDIGAFEFQGLDGDGIADHIGTGAGVFSDAFDDGAGNFGTITDRGGLTVTVTDDAGAGVVIQAVGGAGTATVSVCDGFQLIFTDGDTVTFSCGSVTVTVTEGSVELLLGEGEIVVSLASGAIATVTDNGDGTYTVANEPDSAADVTVTSDGTESVLAPGESTTVEVAVATVTFALVGGFNAIVFPGADATPIEEVAAAMGPSLEAVFRFDAATQTWLVHRPDVVVPGLNTLLTVNQQDVLVVRLPAGAAAVSLTWADALAAGPVSVELPPGFTFVGYTGGAGTALADLLAALPAEVSAAFRYDATTQGYDVFRRGEPAFLSTVTTVDRLDGLFILNGSGGTVTLAWEQVAAQS